MADNKEFQPALRIDLDACTGCTHCMMECPTGAIRIEGGKASIRRNWCVDCAECMKVCPSNAIFVEQNDFNKIFSYKLRVALFPAVFLGQFPEKYSEHEILEALYSLGFTHIFPVEFAIDLIHERMASLISGQKDKPAISPYCPAIVRLIQIRFPDLVGNIMNVRTPIEATAMLYRGQLRGEGHADEDIGLFYVSPCAAKISSLKNHGELGSYINGVLNMDLIFNKVSHALRNKPEGGFEQGGPMPPALSCGEMNWSQTSGEADNFGGRCFAVDEIHNVMEFIEQSELTGDLSEIDFLELRACDRGCVGGVLTPANRFAAAERLYKRSLSHHDATMLYDTADPECIEYLKEHIDTEKTKPMTQLKYPGDITEVLAKMDNADKILALLPGIDCGACGSPGCRSLAEDIVRGEATLPDCVFVQRELERAGKMECGQAFDIVEKVWGKGFLENGKLKPENGK